MQPFAWAALSVVADKGRHTTTTTELFPLPKGGRLIDSPGVRDFGLSHLPIEEVERGFREFQPLLGHCRFRDCRHQSEPGCALLNAVSEGVISAQRFDSYLRIREDLQSSTVNATQTTISPYSKHRSPLYRERCTHFDSITRGITPVEIGCLSYQHHCGTEEKSGPSPLPFQMKGLPRLTKRIPE